ncbi:TetR/AcrR family transcriptional regulator [Amycolatopsis jejuensis]|uniref:TetR/AcrR family transcriptional regulator n=1 Tax=Amycolatopsis jejuensis TaxID=330084 RepID=UPI00068AA298|nr:TetR/AcrR family transcriptional regulator [Amycolatopsis jejuensis]
MRQDAVEKRDRILGAARRVFAEGGQDVTMTRIAHRAGVSLATVYRRFPTREQLVAAAFADQWDDCVAIQDRAMHDPDPARALRDLVRTYCAYELRDRGFTQVFADAAATDDGLTHEWRQAERVISVLLEKAQADGTFRADLSVDDFRLMLIAHRGVVTAAGPNAAAASRRFLTLMLRSFEP